MKYIVVTGAFGGLGHEIVTQASKKFRVIAASRSKREVNLSDPDGICQHNLILDLENLDSIKKFAEDVSSITHGKGLYALINNAGVGSVGPFEFETTRNIQKMIGVNIAGTIFLTHSLVKNIEKGCGRVLNIGSMSGRVAMPFSATYSATKGALFSFSMALRHELAIVGIPVSYIELGKVDTPIWHGLGDVKALLDKSNGSQSVLMDAFGAAVERARRKKGISAAKAAVSVCRILDEECPRLVYCVGRDAIVRRIASAVLPNAAMEWLISRTVSD